MAELINKKMGRPTKYTPQLADEICNAIASSTEGLQSLCDKNPTWPARHNIFIWMRKYPDFQRNYTIAKQHQADVSMDLMQELLAENHHFEDEMGNSRVDVHMLRVKIDAIKWQASKLIPKVYGDKVQSETTVTVKHEDALKDLA